MKKRYSALWWNSADKDSITHRENFDSREEAIAYIVRNYVHVNILGFVRDGEADTTIYRTY